MIPYDEVAFNIGQKILESIDRLENTNKFMVRPNNVLRHEITIDGIVYKFALTRKLS